MEFNMNLVILTDKSNISFYNWANRIYGKLKNKINVKLIDVESNSPAPNNGSIVLQFLQPDYYKCFANCKNIGISKLTVNYPYNQIVDEVWQDFPDVITDTADIQHFNLRHLDGEYIFYSILEDNPEYIENILYAFSKEFDPAEPASLVLKTKNVIDDIIYKINLNLNIFDKMELYKKHTVISRAYKTLQERFSLHMNCDAFLNPNSNFILYKDELDFFGSTVIDYTESITELQKSMRNAYNNKTQKTSVSHDVLLYLMEKLYGTTN
jgi:hypothetical protein